MRVIIDSSALLAVVLMEPEREGLIRMTTGTEASAPEILPYEIGNALSAMIKRDRLSLEQALAAHEAFLRISVRLVSCDIRSALKLSKRLGICAYDAYFMVSAQRLDCPLITLDRRMRQVAQELGIALLESEQ
jgi:predicted nucleic acid-binding protein